MISNTSYSPRTSTRTVLGPALAGFTIYKIGVHWSLCLVVGFALLALVALLTIKKKPIHNPKIGESIFESLKEDAEEFAFLLDLEGISR